MKIYLQWSEDFDGCGSIRLSENSNCLSSSSLKKCEEQINDSISFVLKKKRKCYHLYVKQYNVNVTVPMMDKIFIIFRILFFFIIRHHSNNNNKEPIPIIIFKKKLFIYVFLSRIQRM